MTDEVTEPVVTHTVIRMLLNFGCLAFGIAAIFDIFQGEFTNLGMLLDFGGVCFGAAAMIDLYSGW